MDVYRLNAEPASKASEPASILLAPWLDGLAAERERLIKRLQVIDRELVRHGKLKGETIPRRMR